MNYLEKFLARLQYVTCDGDRGYLARCPCPGHGRDGVDMTPSLRVAIGDGGRILLWCPVGCSFKSILDALNIGSSVLCPNPYLHEEPLPPTTHSEPTQPYDPELAHRVYSHFLTKLPLDRDHSTELLRRGLPKPECDLRGYRSLRNVYLPSALESLCQEFGTSLYQVPGFVEVEGKCTLRPNQVSGLLIPVLDKDRKIQALKVRTQSSECKYVYLSSYPAGRSSGSPLHYPVCPLGVDRGRVRITEGELKADVATYKSGIYTLGVPGVANWWKAVEAVDGAKEVLISFDWRDVKLKPSVRQSVLSLFNALQAKGMRVGIEMWDETYKGIDDVLEAGEEVREVWGLLEVEKLFPVAEMGGEWKPSPFPVEVFPDPLQLYLRQVSKALPCPWDFLGVPMLVVAGAMIGNTKRVVVKESWSEVPNLWAVIVSPPGSIKTPSIAKILKPVKKLQMEALERFKVEHAEWEQSKLVYSAKESAYKADLRKFFQMCPGRSASDPSAPSKPGALPPEPVVDNFLTDNVTLEGLIEDLAESSRGSFRETDEFLSVIKSFDQYRGKGSDRQTYLSLWSSSTVKVDRKSTRVPVICDKPFFSLLGGIQPDKLGELEDEKGAQDGFLDRILFSYPEASALPPFTKDDVEPACELVWEGVVVWLRSLSEEASSVPLSPEAMEVFEQWYEDHRLSAQSPGFPKFQLGFWSKLKAYCIRFSLIIHMLRRACSELGFTEEDIGKEIDKVDMTRAVKLVEYFKNHFQGVYYRFQFDRDDHRIEDFVRYVRESCGGKIEVKAVWKGTNGKRWRLKSRSGAEKFIGKAVDQGFGHWSENGKVFVVEEKG